MFEEFEVEKKAVDYAKEFVLRDRNFKVNNEKKQAFIDGFKACLEELSNKLKCCQNCKFMDCLVKCEKDIEGPCRFCSKWEFANRPF